MDDSWSFRTENGRAWVTGGTLSVEKSLRGFVRGTYHEKWLSVESSRKILFLISLGGTAMWFRRVIPALQAVANPGPMSSMQWFILAVSALLPLAVVRSIGRSKRVPLTNAETVRRTDRTITIEYVEDDERQILEVEACTDNDAEEAVEMLQLKGIELRTDEEQSDPDKNKTKSTSFRERLAKKGRERT